ncbi:rRNA maturation RNase YbeY [Dongia sp.]|uniref:rRNA maturation RNase YbeY n=1 Tax=Dongia sp. TaxID=1977262 RepID=UPI0035B3DD5A
MTKTGPSLKIGIEIADKGWDKALPDAARIARRAARAAIKAALAAKSLPRKRLAEAGKVELGITLDNDRGVRHLNRDYRGKDRPTNVLSFAALDAGLPPKGVPASYPWALGDIVLALGIIKVEARDQRKTLAQHFCHLVVHGVLHLLGFDHEKDRAAHAMEKLEREILAGLGWPDPYR